MQNIVDMGYIQKMADFIKPEAGAKQVDVGGVMVWSSGTILGIPFNLDPSYSDVYKQYLSSSVRETAKKELLSDPDFQKTLLIGAAVVGVGFIAAYKIGKKKHSQR